MPRHSDPGAQAALDNLIKLIKLVPEDELSFIREKLIVDALAYGLAMKYWGYERGYTVGWNTGFHEGSGFDED